MKERTPCLRCESDPMLYSRTLSVTALSVQIPEMRFDPASIPAYLESPSIVSRMGNFLSNPAAFDHKFFNISPRAAEAMDPQQRILLHVAYEALENAGYVPDSTEGWNRERFGCFIGAATGEWADCLREEADLYHSTGIRPAFHMSCNHNKLRFRYPSRVSEWASFPFHEMGRTFRRRRHSLFVLHGGNISSVPCLTEQ